MTASTMSAGMGSRAATVCSPVASFGEAGADWAHRFDDHAEALLTSRTEDAVSLLEHPDAGRAVPTADHFLPLLYTAGMAAASGETLQPFTKDYMWGSLSMTSYRAA